MNQSTRTRIASEVVPAPEAGCRWAGIIVALPEPLAAEITAYRRSFGDALAAQIPAHITLITTTPIGDWAETVQHVRQVAASQRPFRVSVRGTGSFRPVSEVVYLQLGSGFDECVQLHELLQSGPLARDLVFDFHPHITIAHDISAAGLDEAARTLADFEATFPVTGMGLYVHNDSGAWLLKEELKFGGTSENQGTSRYEAAPNRLGKAPA
ncbi:2'-5' RNA ligase family protein [Paeniglutamicibacter antarcticus]|uniref:2'-5' RNA ligase family protein n=1 Tax=Arthrobacter terrae TaxID=2935737 RepID=A0A931CJI7_9MICC|nr:2'-5' RNA ligase family protein [Arthrobacter terrae]MBG0739762.1 2'-5' RNA ligase family protein [Arthrobacter terrae]